MQTALILYEVKPKRGQEPIGILVNPDPTALEQLDPNAMLAPRKVADLLGVPLLELQAIRGAGYLPDREANGKPAISAADLQKFVKHDLQAIEFVPKDEVAESPAAAEAVAEDEDEATSDEETNAILQLADRIADRLREWFEVLAPAVADEDEEPASKTVSKSKSAAEKKPAEKAEVLVNPRFLGGLLGGKKK